ncbi:MAG TPA: hypothetical protein DEF45_26525 [Rhodopirellula sp.]|nr:hypothetical protein [Rhodopirellula sp.]
MNRVKPVIGIFCIDTDSSLACSFRRCACLKTMNLQLGAANTCTPGSCGWWPGLQLKAERHVSCHASRHGCLDERFKIYLGVFFGDFLQRLRCSARWEKQAHFQTVNLLSAAARNPIFLSVRPYTIG